MLDIIEFKPKKEEINSKIETVQVPHYKTTDGKVFVHQFEAEKHQNLLDKAQEIVNNLRYEVHGETMRGYGYETVYASNESLFHYTVKILEKLRKENKYFP